MKRCPDCNSVYTDPTLIYCLADGHVLSDSPDPNVTEPGSERTESNVVTEVMPPEGLPKRIITPTLPSPPAPAWQPVYAASKPAEAPGDRKVFLWVSVGVLLAAVVVLTYFLLQKGSDENRVSANADGSHPASTNSSSTNATTRTQTPTPAPSTTPTPAPTPTPDTAASRAEVVTTMNSWAESLRRQDLSANLSFYADELKTYYQFGSRNKEQIRANRQAIFARYYSSTDIQLSNIAVEIDSTGRTATVRYDNSYNWRGGPKYLVGKSRNEIEFSKVGSRWLITSEKHLQTYNEDSGN